MIKNILFDLGGVLVDLDVRLSMEKLAALVMPQADGTPVTARDLIGGSESNLMQLYQTGKISTEEFVGQVLQVCKPGTTHEQVIDAWYAMLKTIPPQRMEMLRRLKATGYHVYILSNINEAHVNWVNTHYPELREIADHIYYSNEIGIAKPDREAYEYVLQDASIRPEETFYIDDLEQNIEAGRRVGLESMQALGDEWLRPAKVLTWLSEHQIPHTCYFHPEGKTIEEAKRWWKADGSVHCKNLFFRNHKGNQHYLVCFDCDHEMDIHDMEQRLKTRLMAAGYNSPGKLSFASEERMTRYLGLLPGSVSPFGLINDEEHHVILFLDENLRNAETLSFHPNDCRGTVVIRREELENMLAILGNTYEYVSLY